MIQMTETPEVREATVGRGAAIFLSDAQFAALDVDPDAESIRYWVEDGELEVETADKQTD